MIEQFLIFALKIRQKDDDDCKMTQQTFRGSINNNIYAPVISKIIENN